jgi:hypothetical protein
MEMRRIQVWIDCDEKSEAETREKVKSALDSLGIGYTLLEGSAPMVRKSDKQK